MKWFIAYHSFKLNLIEFPIIQLDQHYKLNINFSFGILDFEQRFTRY